MNTTIASIFAHDIAFGIGKNGVIPWHAKEDLIRFRELTSGETVLVGRKTFETLPPLPNRKIIVVSKTLTSNDQLLVVDNPFKSLLHVTTKKLFVIGGSQIYEEMAGLSYFCYGTMILHDYKCDTFLPKLLRVEESMPQQEDRGRTDDGRRCRFYCYYGLFKTVKHLMSDNDIIFDLSGSFTEEFDSKCKTLFGPNHNLMLRCRSHLLNAVMEEPYELIYEPKTQALHCAVMDTLINSITLRQVDSSLRFSLTKLLLKLDNYTFATLSSNYALKRKTPFSYTRYIEETLSS